jgi:NitT/TauT family transport system substrate-binding protein
MMDAMGSRVLRCLLLVLAAVLLGGGAHAQTVRIAAQKTGTLAWELDVVRSHRLDRKANLTIAVSELATPEAGKIALRGGSADLIVSDWLWVSRERGLGAPLVFHPYSSTIGAVMVSPRADIRSLSDLRGRKLAVAGGALDKSWLLLQGAMKRDGIDLRRDATVLFGAPVLLAEKTLQGEMDATLNYWNIAALYEARGLRRLIGVEDVLPKLGVSGRPAMLGYVFDEGWAARNSETIARFLSLTRQAKDILASSDAEWERIAPLTGAPDAATLRLYRERYREGIPRRPVEAEEADARTLFGVLAEQGGASLTGGAAALAPGTFFRPRSGMR